MNIEPKIIELLKKRGIETGEEIHEFLSSKPQKTYDPFLLHNMEEGVDLILSAIEEDRKICIYGYYDGCFDPFNEKYHVLYTLQVR